MPESPPPEPIPSELARRWLGASDSTPELVFRRVTPHTQVHIWQWRGRRVVEKCHLDPARAKRELDCLGEGGPAARLASSPAVLAVEALPGGPVVLLLEHVQGAPAPLEARVVAAAGAWLADLHALPVHAVDSMPLTKALTRRWKAVLRRSRPLLPAATLAQIESLVGPPDALATRPRVHCHRDFTEDNWVWEAPRLWVLDFEHSRPDAPLSDVVKLESDLFVREPSLREPFYAAYGARPPEWELRAWRAWHGLATWTWGVRHHTASFQRLGAEVLRPLEVELPLHPS